LPPAEGPYRPHTYGHRHSPSTMVGVCGMSILECPYAPHNQCLRCADRLRAVLFAPKHFSTSLILYESSTAQSIEESRSQMRYRAGFHAIPRTPALRIQGVFPACSENHCKATAHRSTNNSPGERRTKRGLCWRNLRPAPNEAHTRELTVFSRTQCDSLRRL
jgi:hypothetical protein